MHGWTRLRKVFVLVLAAGTAFIAVPALADSGNCTPQRQTTASAPQGNAMTAHVDPDTGELREPTEGQTGLQGPPADGLAAQEVMEPLVVEKADGSTMVVVGKGFINWMKVRQGNDGGFVVEPQIADQATQPGTEE